MHVYLQTRDICVDGLYIYIYIYIIILYIYIIIIIYIYIYGAVEDYF